MAQFSSSLVLALRDSTVPSRLDSPRTALCSTTMPPKKALVEAVNVIRFGRMKNHLKMGVVGLPNVGKSSLFNLLTSQAAAAENYPFCTIEPNE